MDENPWYKTFFGEDYLRIYSFLTPERTEREVDGIVRLLDLPPGSAILDLCCGHGRHALALAKRGYRVTGQDLSEVFLQRAQAEAEAQGVQVRWLQSDMRKIPFESEFDAVINIFTAFGYLENEDEDQEVLQQVYKALKPHGLFLLETMHREFLLRNFAASEVSRHADGLIVLEERELSMHGLKQEEAMRFECFVYLLEHLLIFIFVLQVAEGCEDVNNSVELALERNLSHVALQPAHLDTLRLRLSLSAL